MDNEVRRQESHIELIASENFTSPTVLAAQGSQLTNKYAEGYPGKRYYGGCEFVDVAEALAIERALELFGADYANVQPHSGSSANAAVFMALINPGDTILGMSLAHGGHLTHGASVNFSGKIYNAVQYGLDVETGEVNYAEVAALAAEHKPKMIIAGFSAYSRTMDLAKFRDIADSIGAYLFVDMAHVAGLVAVGLYPNPYQWADVVTSTTHKTLRGPRGGIILARKNDEIIKKLNSLVFPGTQGGPLMHVIAGKAVAFKEAMEPGFKQYQQNVLDNAGAMVEVFQQRGFDIVSGGTDNHLFLLDLVSKDITGRMRTQRLAVPILRGLRIGTPAMTTRGFGAEESKLIAGWMCDVMESIEDETVIARVKQSVVELCGRFPLYSDRHLKPGFDHACAVDGTAPNSPAWNGVKTTVSRALRLIDEGALDHDDIEHFSGRLGVGSDTCDACSHNTSVASPTQVARARRVLTAKKLITDSDLSMTEVALNPVLAASDS
nr:LOW QUALITY PROTEIN: serine hydroxymethyltransferase-like [Nerophis lumbriciformis]